MSVDSTLIHQWISQVFQNNYRKIVVDLTGASEKGDGYVANIAFVKAHVESENGQKTSYDLAIKYSKAEQSITVKRLFDREMFIYSHVLKAFRTLENDNLIDNFIVKCFGTLTSNERDVIILQNLKSFGYNIHDTISPLNSTHLNLTLENYGRFHAFSLALRQQKPEEFSKLFDGMRCCFTLWIDVIPQLLLKTEDTLYEILKMSGEVDLLARFKKSFSKNFVDILKEVLEKDVDKTVLIHGDCWNNNFMFKYHNNQPVSCKFLDFQNSKLASPIFDLSYHLFATASEKEFEEFDRLLHIYHRSLCQTLKQLGINEDIFTYDDIIVHWKKYSVFGFILACVVCILTLGDKEDALVTEDFEKEHLASSFDKLAEKNMKKIGHRIVSVAKYFLKWHLQ